MATRLAYLEFILNFMVIFGKLGHRNQKGALLDHGICFRRRAVRVHRQLQQVFPNWFWLNFPGAK